MIKINLYHRKAAVGVSATSGASAGLGGFFEKLRGGNPFAGAEINLKALAIQISIYAVIIGIMVWYLGEKRASFLGEVDAQIVSLDLNLSRISSELGKTSQYEQTKKNLELDEKTIRTKINTIQELIRDRSTPPKILMSLSEATPKEVWLRSFSLQNRKFQISGLSSGMEVVSDFMKGLEETIYFKNVVLKSSKTETSQKVGRQTAQFELEGERR